LPAHDDHHNEDKIDDVDHRDFDDGDEYTHQNGNRDLDDIIFDGDHDDRDGDDDDGDDDINDADGDLHHRHGHKDKHFDTDHDNHHRDGDCVIYHLDLYYHDGNRDSHSNDDYRDDDYSDDDDNYSDDDDNYSDDDDNYSDDDDNYRDDGDNDSHHHGASSTVGPGPAERGLQPAMRHQRRECDLSVTHHLGRDAHHRRRECALPSSARYRDVPVSEVRGVSLQGRQVLAQAGHRHVLRGGIHVQKEIRGGG